MRNGKIGVTTENIFPVIKKFLYSDHEIFLRELVSNAVDATQKLKTLTSKGEANVELGDLTIRIDVDTEAKRLTITDRGIGMSIEEVDRYINQIAFSGAEEFMAKYKDQAIIGHFGLGFYSSFMVADKVEIFSQSYNTEAKSVHWSCNGSPEFEMEELDEKLDRGTRIVLHLSEECSEYAERSEVGKLLRKYCHFLPIAIAFGKKQEWKDGKYVDTNEDNIINDTEPLWMRKPTDITEEEYKAFYAELYPTAEEPLFYIHLNIDYPFNLTGILYFPKIHSNFEIQKNKIQLYSNQVFVTDEVTGIVPEYLTLLHGVIDSPDIPLNVSRSYLQSDSNVKKISSYSTPCARTTRTSGMTSRYLYSMAFSPMRSLPRRLPTSCFGRALRVSTTLQQSITRRLARHRPTRMALPSFFMSTTSRARTPLSRQPRPRATTSLR